MGVEVFAEDLRQFHYCKRIIYYRYVLRARTRPTRKMEFGSEIEKLSRIASGDEDDVYRSVYLYSDVLNLGCVVDALLVSGDEVKVLEVKSSRYSKRIDEHHKIQLAAQILLVKEAFPDKDVKGYIYYAESGELNEVELREHHFSRVMDYLGEIREIIWNELLPEPTPNRGKCVDCEFRRFCLDVF